MMPYTITNPSTSQAKVAETAQAKTIAAHNFWYGTQPNWLWNQIGTPMYWLNELSATVRAEILEMMLVVDEYGAKPEEYPHAEFDNALDSLAKMAWIINELDYATADREDFAHGGRAVKLAIDELDFSDDDYLEHGISEMVEAAISMAYKLKTPSGNYFSLSLPAAKVAVLLAELLQRVSRAPWPTSVDNNRREALEAMRMFAVVLKHAAYARIGFEVTDVMLKECDAAIAKLEDISDTRSEEPEEDWEPTSRYV